MHCCLPAQTSLTYYNADCSLNTDACMPNASQESCGNDSLDEGEICDGSQIRETAACLEGMHLPEGKAFACHADCTLDMSACETTIAGTLPQGRVVPDEKHSDLTEIPLHRTPQDTFPNEDLFVDRENEPSQIVAAVPKDAQIDIIGSVGEKWLVRYNEDEGYIDRMHVQRTNDLEIPALDYSSPATANYYQKNENRKDTKVCTVGTVESAGGVPVSVANAVSSIKGTSVTPDVVANKVDTYLGNSADYICQLVQNEYQLECEYLDNKKGMNGGSNTTNDAAVRSNAKAKMQEAFKNGWYVAAEEGCGKSSYWGAKRTILVYGYDEKNDRVFVDDPQNLHYMEEKGIESFLNCSHSMSIIKNTPCTPDTCQKSGDNQKPPVVSCTFKVPNTSGTKYYVSASGTSTKGTDPKAPMGIETANSKKFKAGDQILLKSGDIYYTQLKIETEPGIKSPIYISAYGDGALPVVTPAKVIDSAKAWEKTDTHIWRVNLKNTGSYSGYKGTDAKDYNIGFIKTPDGQIHGRVRSELAQLKDPLDYFGKNEYLYIYSDDNPYKSYGTLILAPNIIAVQLNSNTDISCIHVRDTGSHGVRNATFPLTSGKIHNLVITDIGGSIQNPANSTTRYGNGIEIWGTASAKDNKNNDIYHNLIRNVFDSGITFQGNDGSYTGNKIHDNIIIRSSASFELWSHNANDNMSIEVYNNYSVFAGKGWGNTDRGSNDSSKTMWFGDYTFGWFGDYTFGKFGGVNATKLSLKNNISVSAFRVFRFTTDLPQNQKITWSGNTGYLGDHLHHIIQSKPVTSTDINAYLATYPTMNTWTMLTMTDAENEELDCAAATILNSLSYDEILNYLKTNFPLQSK